MDRHLDTGAMLGNSGGMSHRGLTFGIFLAPFHRVGENPMLAIARDMELLEWLDHLGYDEAWIGEHHSAGWELIASPELVIAAAAERTRHIMLGSGVTSLPYHNPLLVAPRFLQLDHMTRRRALLGCGPGVLSLAAGLPGGPEALAGQWRLAEETAAAHGKTMDRRQWRLVTNVHVAEDDELALRQVNVGERHETVTYFEETLGRPPGRSDDPLTEGVKMGTTLVGSVETVVRGIEHLQRLSDGFGGLLFRAHEWANREQTLKSYELFARYVMPRFQGSLETILGSNAWAQANRKAVFGPNVEAVRQAYLDAGRAVPDDFRWRTAGARDVDPEQTPDDR